MSIRLQSTVHAIESFSSAADFQDLFWKIFHHTAEGIALTDESGKILVCNTPFISQILQPAGFSDLCHLISTDMPEGGATKPFTIQHHLIPEHIRLEVMGLHPGFGRRGYIWLAMSTTQGDAAAEVKQVKYFYRAFVDSSFELVFRTSLHDEILFANKLFLSSFGFARYHDAKATRIADLFEEAEDYVSFRDRLVRERQVSGEVLRFKTSSGARLLGKVNCQLYVNQHGEYALNWTVLDVTERLEFEHTIKAKHEELERLNSKMEKFLYSTSHDLRSPLTSILGLINLMRMENPDRIITDYIDKIEVSAFRLDKIIRDLMGFTKTSYQRTQAKRINLADTTWYTIRRYQQEPCYKSIHFEVNVQEVFPFYSDAERFEIILDNLIRNAIHFYDANKVRPFIRVNISSTEDKLLLEVLDNGIGIGKAHQEQIFNLFYKASSQSRGAGLGLYIVKESVQQLSGTVSVESELGFGSAFRVQIPNHPKGKLISRKIQLQQHD